MNPPFFSVIVPVYNVKEYLSQCISSVLKQDFDDFELILVDDGSTDGSSKLCDEFAMTDERVHLIHKSNGGLSEARNYGLEQAVGEYIWFLDSDDYLIDNQAFSYIRDYIKNKNADVVFFSYKKYFENTNTYSDPLYRHISENEDIREYIRLNAYKTLAWNKVVKRSLIEKYNMRFPIGRLGEDLVWCSDLLAYADNITLCRIPLLAYRQREGSITSKKEKSFRRKGLSDVLYLLNEAVEKNGIQKDSVDDGCLIAHFLAYEYCWMLGAAFPFWKDYSGIVKELSFLLNYDLEKKVSKVKKVKNIFGLKGTSFILYMFIKLKNKR